jgi:hypothetical protein
MCVCKSNMNCPKFPKQINLEFAYVVAASLSRVYRKNCIQ